LISSGRLCELRPVGSSKTSARVGATLCVLSGVAIVLAGAFTGQAALVVLGLVDCLMGAVLAYRARR